ncbi:MAG: copper amine oxidase N-terminal domain-containing protein [Clostridiales bacterium]|nr:copper amine oxidase N-terminal domain-containing protein [Clostridiales bacterium]
MKKFACLCMAFVFASGGLAVYGFEDIPEVYVDNKKIEFEVEPEIIEGEVYVPLRPVLEAYLNREVSFRDSSSGKILILETADGRFSLNIDNGAYSYVIDNYSYGVISLFDDTGEDKMGILNHTPFIKEGFTMAPLKEIIEILDGSAYYDEEFNQISIVSETYTQNVEFAGEPFPVVFVFSDMDIYQSEKLADNSGYEELVELCKEYYGENPDYSKYDYDGFYAEDDEYGDYEYFDYYNDFYGSYYGDTDEGEVLKALFDGLKENADNPLVKGVIKDFLSKDYSDILITDNELTMEESLDSCAKYMFKAFFDSEYEGVIYLNGEYEELAKYIIEVVDFFGYVSNIMETYIYTDEDFNYIVENSYYFQLIDTYIYEIYDDEVTDYLEMKLEDLYLEYETE